ncbi:MAG TPA: glycosyltransferase [Magnetospirillaceae bacterium]|nr:glycosyltransferase [Magnetospirillaceae bacterium]
MAVRQPKIAIVCDWLTNMGGAERVVLSLHKAFPDAPIYTSVFTPETMPAFSGLDVRTSFLQKLPSYLRSRHQLFPLQRTQAFRALDLREYDIIISSASAEAKAVIKRPDAIHICYCHTPTRYYWSHYKEYLASPGLGPLNPVARVALPALVRLMRKLDLQAVEGVDYFIANSSAVAGRIKKYYGHESTIIYPPVSMERFTPLDITGPRKGFVVVGRQVPYKRFDLAVSVCSERKLPLTLYGTGPDHKRLVQMAGPTVRFVEGANDAQVAKALSKAAGYIFPQEEDLGITQLEPIAAGCPVIAFAKGGALDVVIDGKTGIFFDEQTPESLGAALDRFATLKFVPKILQKHAEQFSEERFVREVQSFVHTHKKPAA